MAHPYLAARGHALHQRIAAVDEVEVGAAVLANLALLHTSATPFGQILSTVAYGQQGQFAFDVRHIGHWGIGGVAAEGAAGEDHPFHLGGKGGDFIKRMDFTVNMLLSNFARNQLSVLRAKV